MCREWCSDNNGVSHQHQGRDERCYREPVILRGDRVRSIILHGFHVFRTMCSQYDMYHQSVGELSIYTNFARYGVFVGAIGDCFIHHHYSDSVDEVFQK